MQQVDFSAVPNWKKFNGYWVPESVDHACPYCAKLVNFSPYHMSYEKETNSILAVARCPGCRESVYFWFIDTTFAINLVNKECAQIVLYPSPRIPKREGLKGYDIIPVGIRRAYLEALDVYNAGVWGVLSTCGKRALETILSDLLPAGKQTGSFADQVMQLSASMTQTKPLLAVANMLRQDGPLGTCLEYKTAPDQATALALVEVVEILLQYGYTLPNFVEKLQGRLGSLPGGSS